MSSVEFDFEGKVNFNPQRAEMEWWNENKVIETDKKQCLSLVYAKYRIDVYAGDLSTEYPSEWKSRSKGYFLNKFAPIHWNEVRSHLLARGWREIHRTAFEVPLSDRHSNILYMDGATILVSPRY